MTEPGPDTPQAATEELEALLPCPFCGSAARMTDCICGKEVGVMVFCSNHECSVCPQVWASPEDRHTAPMRWNGRSFPPSEPTEREALAEIAHTAFATEGVDDEIDWGMVADAILAAGWRRAARPGAPPQPSEAAILAFRNARVFELVSSGDIDVGQRPNDDEGYHWYAVMEEQDCVADTMADAAIGAYLRAIALHPEVAPHAPFAVDGLWTGLRAGDAPEKSP